MNNKQFSDFALNLSTATRNRIQKAATKLMLDNTDSEQVRTIGIKIKGQDFILSFFPALKGVLNQTPVHMYPLEYWQQHGDELIEKNQRGIKQLKDFESKVIEYLSVKLN